MKLKVKDKENLLVEESILRLELRKLRGFLNARADDVVSLESRQLQLELALQERNKEIEIHKDILRVHLKSAEDERHSASAELRDRVTKVEKLKTKYEILMTQFTPEDDEEEHTQAYYVIKASQKREQLQNEGDLLDSNIQRAAKEINGLEATLNNMNDRNEGFKINLYQSELDDKDFQHKEMLEIVTIALIKEYRGAMESFIDNRDRIQDLQHELSDLERKLEAETAQEASQVRKIQAIESRIQICTKEVVAQTDKRKRAYLSVQKHSKQLRLVSNTFPKPANEEYDFVIRNLRDIGTIALTELNKLMLMQPDLAMTIREMMVGLEISVPSQAVSRASSRASGNQSAPVSRSSSRASLVPRLPTNRGSIIIPASNTIEFHNEKIGYSQAPIGSIRKSSIPRGQSPRSSPRTSKSQFSDPGTVQPAFEVKGLSPTK